MQITSNVIHFPTLTPITATRAAETQSKPETKDNVVDFPAWPEETLPGDKLQTHGQLFAAERIVSRIATQLEALPNL